MIRYSGNEYCPPNCFRTRDTRPMLRDHHDKKARRPGIAGWCNCCLCGTLNCSRQRSLWKMEILPRKLLQRWSSSRLARTCILSVSCFLLFLFLVVLQYQSCHCMLAADRRQALQDAVNTVSTSCSRSLFISPTQYFFSLPFSSSSNNVGTIWTPTSSGAMDNTLSVPTPELFKNEVAVAVFSGRTATRCSMPPE